MNGDQIAIENIITQMEAAWNRHDSVSYAALFTEDAQFIQIYGGQLDGRAAIEGSHRGIFDSIYKGSRATFEIREIRFLRPEVAIAFTKAHLDYLQGGEKREMNTRPTMILVKENGKWQIVAVQNTRVSEMPAAAEAAARLAT